MATETIHLTPTERRFLTALAAGQRVIIGTPGKALARSIDLLGARAGVTLRIGLSLHERGLIDATGRLRWRMASGVTITEAGRAAAGEA